MPPAAVPVPANTVQHRPGSLHRPFVRWVSSPSSPGIWTFPGHPARRRAVASMPRPMSPAPATAEEIRDVNTRYHDGAAADYDAKWGIDFGEIGRAQVLGKLRKALGGELRSSTARWRSARAPATSRCNLLQAGVIARRDVHRHLAGHGRRAGGERAAARPRGRGARRRRRGAAVRGRALRPRPRPRRAAPPARPRRGRSREFHRVLRPGGVVVFAGEPSRYGDRIATVPKRVATAAAPAWRAALRAGPAASGHRDGGAENHELERTSTSTPSRPSDLERARAARRLRRRPRARRGAAGQLVRLGQPRAGGDGRSRRRCRGPGSMYAFRGYLALQQVDRALLEPRLPSAIFYNLHASRARKLAAASA